MSFSQGRQRNGKTYQALSHCISKKPGAWGRAWALECGFVDFLKALLEPMASYPLFAPSLLPIISHLSRKR